MNEIEAAIITLDYCFKRLETQNKQLLDVCEFALLELNDMTTDQFSKGEDKIIRKKLQAIIHEVRQEV